MPGLQSERGETDKSGESSAVGQHGPTSRGGAVGVVGGIGGVVAVAAVGGRRGTGRSRRLGAGAGRGARRLGLGSGEAAALARGRDFQPADLAAARGVDGQLDGRLGDGHDGALGPVGHSGGNQVGDAGGHGGDVEVGAEACVADEARGALGRFEVGGGRVVVLDQRHVQAAVLLGQGVVVAAQVHGAVAVGVDDAVVVGLLGPLEDQAAGHDGHLLAVKGGDFVESARLHFVAAVLGEEDGDGAVAEHLDELVVAGRFEGRLAAAPRVRVQAQEVGARHVFAAVLGVVALQVGVRVCEDLADVGGGVTDGDGAVGVSGDVVFHLTGQGADVGRVLLGGVHCVHDLVAGEEGESVGVVFEGLDHGEDVLEVGFCVGRARVVAVDVLVFGWGVDVKDDVDSDGVEDGHAFVVVERRVEVV